MKERFAKLIDVKSIMTLALTIVFCVLALTGVISGEQFLTIFVTVVGFYFGTQSAKKTTEDKKSAEPVDVVIEQPVEAEETVDAATYNETHPSEDAV